MQGNYSIKKSVLASKMFSPEMFFKPIPQHWNQEFLSLFSDRHVFLSKMSVTQFLNSRTTKDKIIILKISLNPFFLPTKINEPIYEQI